eukprot:6209134-Pleurochrysis_carterae.AAC.5
MRPRMQARARTRGRLHPTTLCRIWACALEHKEAHSTFGQAATSTERGLSFRSRDSMRQELVAVTSSHVR